LVIFLDKNQIEPKMITPNKKGLYPKYY